MKQQVGELGKHRIGLNFQWWFIQFNASNFGVAISANLSSGIASLLLTAEIDGVTVKVFFNLVLPVELINFKAIQQGDKERLDWVTTSENNNNHFTVECSADGTTGWQPITTVTGSGNSNTTSYFRQPIRYPYL